MEVIKGTSEKGSRLYLKTLHMVVSGYIFLVLSKLRLKFLIRKLYIVKSMRGWYHFFFESNLITKRLVDIFIQ